MPEIKDASFSIRMYRDERANVDKVAKAYSRPRSWVITRMLGLLVRLIRGRKAKTITANEEICLTIMESDLRAPVNPRDEE